MLTCPSPTSTSFAELPSFAEPPACPDTPLGSRAVPAWTEPGHLHKGCGFLGGAGPRPAGEGRGLLAPMCTPVQGRARNTVGRRGADRLATNL